MTQPPKNAPLPWRVDPSGPWRVLDANGRTVISVEGHSGDQLAAFLVAAANAQQASEERPHDFLVELERKMLRGASLDHPIIAVAATDLAELFRLARSAPPPCPRDQGQAGEEGA